MRNEQIVRYMMSKKFKENEYICWDFVRDVMKDLYNYILPEYPVTEVQAEFKNRVVANLKPEIVEEGQAKEGDLIVFSLYDSQHAGVMIDKENYIHLAREGVQVCDLANTGKNYVIYRVL